MPRNWGGGVTVVSANPTTIPKLLLIHHLPCCYGWTNGQVTEPTYKRTEDFCWGCRKCFSFPNKMQDPRAPSSSLSPDLMWTRPLESQQSSCNQAGQARRPADVTAPTSLSQRANSMISLSFGISVMREERNTLCLSYYILDFSFFAAH